MVGDIVLLRDLWNKIGPFDMNSFRDRILLQKKVFILQEMGLNVGYNFSLYLRGPYCSTLANDGYKLNTLSFENENGKIPENFIEKLKELEADELESSSWFELLATIVFSIKKLNHNKEESRKFIFENKPHLASNSLFEKAFNILQKTNLI